MQTWELENRGSVISHNGNGCECIPPCTKARVTIPPCPLFYEYVEICGFERVGRL